MDISKRTRGLALAFLVTVPAVQGCTAAKLLGAPDVGNTPAGRDVKEASKPLARRFKATCRKSREDLSSWQYSACKAAGYIGAVEEVSKEVERQAPKL